MPAVVLDQRTPRRKQLSQYLLLWYLVFHEQLVLMLSRLDLREALG